MGWLSKIVACLSLGVAIPDRPSCECNGFRPAPDKRLFTSAAVESLIDSFKPRFRSDNISRIFENAFPNSLDTTVVLASRNDSFVITGDIEAMWLRDSTNQLLPYVPLARGDRPLRDMLCGVVRRQARLVTLNPYGNSFNINSSGAGRQGDSVHTTPSMTYCEKGNVFESKYELDSLAHVLKLAYAYWNHTNDESCFLDLMDEWRPGMEAILNTITAQQASTQEDFDDPAYSFQRQATSATDTLLNRGRGVPAARTGLSKSYFRASDDAQTLPFNIPANALATVELRHLAQLLHSLGEAELAVRATALSAELQRGLLQHGTASYGGVDTFAYEVDGFGSAIFMDDANIPSLLALPYIGYTSKDDPTYLATRARVLSPATNPWFFNGTAGEGVGGPHQGTNFIWPMAIIIRALTSTHDDEIQECLELLAKTHADTFFIHESFHKNDANHFTRKWFSWANSLFGELIITLARERPHLIFKNEFPSISIH